MRAVAAIGLLVVTALSGCSGDDDAGGRTVFDEFGLEPPVDGGGAIVGVVVDQAIRPIPDVLMTLTGAGSAQETTTNAEGRFAFTGLAPGIYTLRAEKPVYDVQEMQVQVQAGGDPPLVNVQMERLFSQDPYIQAYKLKGFMTCGFSVGLSGPCLLDFTQLVPKEQQDALGCDGGCAPILDDLGTQINPRRFVTPVELGWQTIVAELLWEPASTATGATMSYTSSFWNRTTAHSFGSTRGESPLHIQFNVTEEYPNAGSLEPTIVPTEGMDNWMMFANAGSTGLIINQDMEAFIHHFMFAHNPPGWSFVAGDAYPW